MKSLYFTADHEIFRRMVRQFVEKEVTPHAEEWEKNRAIPRAIWNRMGELGFFGIDYREKYGGTATLFIPLSLLEELPRSTTGGFAAAVSVHAYMAAECTPLRKRRVERELSRPRDFRKKDRRPGHHGTEHGLGRGGHQDQSRETR